MGWAVYYALNRAAPLAEAERATLIAHAERWTSHPWQSEAYALHLLAMGEARRDGDPLAWGWTKLPSDPEHPDVERLLEALSELHGLIEGASVAVQDDLHSVGWTARGYALDWAGRQPEVSLPESGPRWIRAAQQSLPCERVALAAEAIAALPTATDLDRAARHARARLRAVPDRAALREPLLGLWRIELDRRGFSLAREEVLKLVAADGWLQEELGAVLRGDDPRRREAATELLASSRTPRAAAALVEAIARARTLPSQMDEGTLLRALGRFRRADLAPSLILTAAAPGCRYVALRVLGGLCGETALPWLDRAVSAGTMVDWAAMGIAEVGKHSPQAQSRLRGLLSHPLCSARLVAIEALGRLPEERAAALGSAAIIDEAGALDEYQRTQMLRALGVEPAPAVSWPQLLAAAGAASPGAELAPPLEDLGAISIWRRQQGIRRVRRHRRADPTAWLAIQLEHELSTAAPRWQRTYPPEWEKWAELPADTIPEKLRERATTAQIEALPDLLRAVFRDGAPSAAARFGDQPPPALPVSDEERMTLEAEERAIIAAGEALAAPL